MTQRSLDILTRALNAQKTAADIGKVNSAVSGLGRTAQASGNPLNSAFNAISAGASRAGSALGHAAGQIKGLVTGPLGFLGLTGGLLSIGGLFGTGLSKAQSWGLQIEKLQGITRDSAEQLSGLLAVTEKYGLSNERLAQIAGFTEKALGNLEKGLTDTGLALAGTSKKVSGSQKFLADYGFNIRDAQGHVKDFSTLLLTFSDYWNGNTAQGLKAAAAAKLFGRGYADLVPILNLGSKGIKDAEDQAKALGLTLTQQNVVDLAKAREATRQWGDALGGLQLQLGLTLLPRLTELATWATTFVSQHRDQIVGFFKSAGDFAASAAATVGNLAGAIAGFWNSIPEGLRTALLTGFAADKTISFLFGMDPAKATLNLVTKGLENALGGAVGKGIVSAGLGKLFVQPVWVTNPGFGGAGGALDVAAAGGAGILTMALTAVTIDALVVGLGQAVANAIGATPQNPVDSASRSYYRHGGNANGPSGGNPSAPLNLTALLNAIPGAAALMGVIGTGVADRNAWVAAQTSHAGARSAFNVRAFRGSASGAISEFPDLLRYLAGAQGAYGGKGSAGFLGGVRSEIGTLQGLMKGATPGQQSTIAGEIVILQKILRDKRFEPSPALLTALKADGTTGAGKRADDLVLPLARVIPKPPASTDDIRESTRLNNQAQMTAASRIDGVTSAVVTMQNAVVAALGKLKLNVTAAAVTNAQTAVKRTGGSATVRAF